MKAMGTTRSGRKDILRVCLIIFSIVFAFTGVLLILHYWENQQGHFDGVGEPARVVWYDGQRYVLRNDIETFLLIGLDSFENEEDDSYYNNERADFLTLILLDHKNKTCTALHIDRDTIADVQQLGIAGKILGTEKEQLALAHTYGSGGHDSCINTAKAVSGLLHNITINHYMSITMNAVKTINDEVGGVTVTVLDDMTSVDKSFVEGATITLRGEQALLYVRSRFGLDDSSNRRRMERQRQYMDALYQKLSQNSSEDAGFGASTLKKLSSDMLSDCTVQRLDYLLETSGKYEFIGIDIIEGESVVGEEFMEFYPDEAALEKLIIDLFYKPED